jgi:nitrite reductase/ring-hydroxylating ferredoxin subunit
VADRYIVGRASDIGEGESVIVTVNGRSIGIFRIDGEFHALLNRCPHAGGELCKGVVVGTLEASRPGVYTFDNSRKLLSCPWHGWEFDIKTGQSYFDPVRTRVRTYPVAVEDGTAVASALEREDIGLAAPSTPVGARVEGPYVAETFPIVVEDDYLVVDLRPARTRSQPRPSQRPEGEAIT